MSAAQPRFNIPVWVSMFVSILALFATSYNAYTSHESLKTNKEISLESQRVMLFANFQQQYNNVSSRFPKRVLDSKFRPAKGSDDYQRLQAYWLFCFSEWYATHKINEQGFGPLWKDYYSQLILGALETPSLKGVLEDMIAARTNEHGDWDKFLIDLSDLAKTGGQQLDPKSEQYIESRRNVVGK